MEGAKVNQDFYQSLPPPPPPPFQQSTQFAASKIEPAQQSPLGKQSVPQPSSSLDVVARLSKLEAMNKGVVGNQFMGSRLSNLGARVEASRISAAGRSSGFGGVSIFV